MRRDGGEGTAERRTRLELYLDILLAVQKGFQGTGQIMYAVTVPRATLEPILASLTSMGLLEAVRDLDWRAGKMRLHYGFTRKGEGLMRFINDHTDLLRDRELRELHR